MGILGRRILREVAASSVLGAGLFTFVLFLERLRPLFELLIRSSAPPATVATLFGLILPQTLTFTIPLGVLAGVLLTMSRMSADAEITAMRAAGVSSRRVLAPVLTWAVFGMVLTAAASLWLTPWAVRQRYRMINKLAATQLTAEIQPRVFEEKFPNTILYVGDVVPGPVVRWRHVFLADVTPAEQRRESVGNDSGQGPRITLASEAVAVPDVARSIIQLRLAGGSTHLIGQKPENYYSSTFPVSDQVLQAQRPAEIRPRLVFSEMDTMPLLRAASSLSGRERTDARLELHQRAALPLACILLALIGVPLGVSSRKAGRSASFVLTVLIAFLYYMALITMFGLAREGRLPPGPAVWAPNLVLLVVSMVLLLRLETPGDRDVIGAVSGWATRLFARLGRTVPEGLSRRGTTVRDLRMWNVPLLPQLVDTFVLSSFLYYFFALLTAFVLMTHVFTFFDLLGDIVRNSIPLSTVARYLVFLTPQLVYVVTPVAVLVAVLVTFGIQAKNNELTAMKACGVSLYRLAVPILLTSVAISATLFASDYTFIPEANLIQDALRNQIKGRPVQTFLNKNQKWIFGKGPRIYYYRYFDQNEGLMLGVNVYELDPATNRLTRLISAERARWEPALNTWTFQNGWARDLRSNNGYTSFEGGAATFRSLDEPPSWFLKEVKQDKQMNAPELAAYIDELRQSGFDTVRLQVQLHRKFAVPLFAVIMALISVPFAFVAGARGAVAGVGISFAIAVAYWAVNQIFEQIGNVNQLPPALAAWAPDALFALCGLYLLARIRT